MKENEFKLKLINIFNFSFKNIYNLEKSIVKAFSITKLYF